MLLDTTKETLCVNRVVGKKKEIIMVEGDIIVPDIKPDILNTACTSGNVFVYKKETLDEKVRLDGSVCAEIVYLADNDDNSIRGLKTTLDFTEIIDFEKCKSGMMLNEYARIKNIECKVLNSRKINVKASIEVEMSVCSDENIEIVNKINEAGNIQFLKNSLEVNSLCRQWY